MESEGNWIKHEHPNWFKRTYSNIMGNISHIFLKEYLKWGTTYEWKKDEDDI